MLRSHCKFFKFRTFSRFPSSNTSQWPTKRIQYLVLNMARTGLKQIQWNWSTCINRFNLKSSVKPPLISNAFRFRFCWGHRVIWYRNIASRCSEGMVGRRCVCFFWIWGCRRAWRQKNDFRDIRKLFVNCASRYNFSDRKCSLRQCELRGSTCHSRELIPRFRRRLGAKDWGNSSSSSSKSMVRRHFCWNFISSWMIWMTNRIWTIVSTY